MGHSLAALGTASLDTMAGLVTLANARDLPEGASPRCWDVDFIVGSVFTRPGLQSVYTYSTTLVITGYVLFSNIATFTYSGAEPTTNEGFLLSGFTGNQTYLNGLTVFVIVATPTTFTAIVNHANDGPISGISATAVSTTGLFVGPNLGSTFVNNNSAWVNPQNIFSATGYASTAVAGGSSSNETFAPAGIVQTAVSGEANWTNIGNATSSSAVTSVTIGYSTGGSGATYSVQSIQITNQGSGYEGSTFPVIFTQGGGGSGAAAYATVNPRTGGVQSATVTNGGSGYTTAPRLDFSTGNGDGATGYCNMVQTGGGSGGTNIQASQLLQATSAGFSIPSNATITGVVISFNAQNAGVGNVTISAQLLQNGATVGTIYSQAIGSTLVPYSLGSSQYLWGATLNPSLVNNTSFGVQLQATIPTDSFSGSVVNLQALKIAVYYTTSTSAPTGELFVEGFFFAVSPSLGISGISTSFSAYTSSNTLATFQLLQNGSPVGTSKIVQLTQTATLYTLGTGQDLWGASWTPDAVNNSMFGVAITSSGTGTTYVGDLDITVYLTPALANFNYIGSYEQNNLTLTTLALDSTGTLWEEDVITNQGVLTVGLTGIIPGSFAQSSTMDNKQFIMLSDLTEGTDRPRLLDTNGIYYPVTQVGPAVSPSVTSTTSSTVLIITSYSFVQAGPPGYGGTLTLGFNAVSIAPTAGTIYSLSMPSVGYLNGQSIVVQSGATTTSLTAAVGGGVTHATDGGGATSGTATQQFSYGIASITQPPAFVTNISGPTLAFSQGAGVGSTVPGNNVTVYYEYFSGGPAGNSATGDPALLNADVLPTYVYISGANNVVGTNYNGVWLVTGTGVGKRPGYNDETLWYFTFTYPNSSQALGDGGQTGSAYRVSTATLVTSVPVLGLTIGSKITITGESPAGWNNTWTILEAQTQGFIITSTAYSSSTATYGYAIEPTLPPQPAAGPPVAGQLVEITGCTNNGAFNGIFVISTVNTGANTFTVSLNATPSAIAQAVEANAQAITSGTNFVFDPGENFVGPGASSTIYGNVTVDSLYNGRVFSLGNSLIPIGAGTRQAACFYITESGNWTPLSPPVTFNVSSYANQLTFTNIPIGPPDVVGRGIVITEAGQNGVAGSNFYLIPEAVTQTVNGVTSKAADSTIINDNTSTSLTVTFTDAVLLNSEEVDIPGNNLFGLIEIGSCAWCVPYSERMFYGMQLNKVNNFNNLSFDGGAKNPVPNPDGTNTLPLGWSQFLIANEGTLVNSPVTGWAYYISNTTGKVQTAMGTITTPAYTDIFNVPIIQTNTQYSVRITCACPSGVQTGTLDLSLIQLSAGIFSGLASSFQVPLASMGETVQVFTGALTGIQTTFTTVPAGLVLRVQVQNMGIGADCLIDRIEIFPTEFPYLNAQVYGSYINEPEEVDATPQGGIIDTSSENAQKCVGGFVMRDLLYLMKTSSLYSTRDNPNVEPGGWSLTEVSNRVGAIGIHSFDTGEEWAVMANRSGIYGFNGGQPTRLTEEIFQIWEAINWEFGYTIVLRNDLQNRRILCAVPLPTGTSPQGLPTSTVTWLPDAPYNPNPTTPNVILMCNYQALGNFEQLIESPELHVTMFGTLAVQDMKRKWTIWNIPTPYMGFVTRANLIDQPLFICNGIGSSKIYELVDSQFSDDGQPIYSLYTTYGHVNAAKAVTMPIFGMHTKRYTLLQANIEGAGNCTVRMLPNVLSPRYPYTVPGGINLVSPAQDDFFRSINCKGQRIFLEFSMNAVGSWFHLNKTLLTGKQDPWSSLNPTGGGNQGVF